MSMVRLDHLSKIYGEKAALHNVSFSVERGSIVAVLGHNGAGKTTLINSIMNLTDYEGEIEYGFDRKLLYRKIGYQMQSSSYEKEAKVHEVCKLYRKILKSSVDLDRLLADFGLTESRNLYIKNLSGGQRQSLSVLLTLIGEPELIIFDELSTGMDAMARRRTWDYIKRLNEEKGITIILTSHFLDEVEYLADRVVILDQGQVSRIGTVSDIVREQFDRAKKIEFRTDDREAFGRSFGSKLSGRGEMLCVQYQEEDEEDVYRKVKGLGGYDISIKNYTFEDAFLNMLGYTLVKNGEMSHG
ncbi:ABC transporter ATP-binding protein [Saccharibacillus sacchari]|uniref:ABC transporter ATP-binding protein n=1 Tax=Saccharibacillus sacchari TaxID=456493 RepID=UPI0004B0C6DF|nr:ABC transporter ATP-binding protein [Saccharibacillus sacchari]